MSEDNEQYAYLTFSASIDPAEITQQLGVEPTESWRKGDAHSQNRLERKFNRWILKSRLARTDDLEDHIKDVLAQMDQRSEAFRTASRQFEGCMQLVAYFNTDYPGLQFDRQIVEGLANYALSVDFDFYYLQSDSNESSQVSPEEC